MQQDTPDPRRFFVTGTNTEVGKTYVTSLIAKQLATEKTRVGVYKPVASGCIHREGVLVSEDAEQLWLAAGKPESLADVTPQLFAAPVAPHVAARMEGKCVDRQLLRDGWRKWEHYDAALIEGVGGLMSPMSDKDLVLDLAVEFGFPLLIVVANELGCINQTLQTIEVAQHRQLNIAGIVLNSATRDQDESCATNEAEIARWSDVPIVATVRWCETEIRPRESAPWITPPK